MCKDCKKTKTLLDQALRVIHDLGNSGMARIDARAWDGYFQHKVNPKKAKSAK